MALTLEEVRLSTVTKKQHYVWQYYLKPWTNNGKIYCYRQSETQIDKRIFVTGTKAIASETYFYRSSRLSEVDLKYVDSIIGKAASDELRELHRGTVDMFQYTFTLRDKLAELPLSDAGREALERQLEEIDKTLGERFHSSIESSMVGTLGQLQKCECAFFQEPEKASVFVNFIAHQFFRTPRLRDVVARIEHEIPNLDLNRIWLIESHIYATNIGAGIFAEKGDYRFTFLENKSVPTFITGDQPVINLNTQNDKEIRLYMPLTPSLAMIFTRDVSIPNAKIVKTASSIEVEYYNKMIYSNSADQIYSNNRNYLTELSKGPKNILAAD
jgi:hypothetical protein